jgi:hypothetical protein
MMIDKRAKEQLGMATIMVAAILLPLMVLMFQVGLELVGLFSTIRSLESQMDKLALKSAQRLPDEEMAFSVAKKGLAAIIGHNSVLERLKSTVHLENEQIVLELGGVYRPIPSLNTSADLLALPVVLRVEAARAAGVATVLLDMSSHFGPLNETEVDGTRASNYFISQYGDTSLARLRTQRCVNGTTAVLKRGALALHGWFAMDSRQEPLVGTFPGFSTALGKYQHVHWLDSDYDFGFRGLLSTDQSCRQQAEFEGSSSHLSLPEGFSAAWDVKEKVWGKALQEERTNEDHIGMAAAEALSLMSQRESQKRSPIHKLLVILAGDVPDLSSRGSSLNDLAHVLINASQRGGGVRLHYLVFQDEILRGSSPGASARLDNFVRRVNEAFALAGVNSKQIKFSGTYFDEESQFYEQVKELMRLGVGPAVVRRGM